MTFTLKKPLAAFLAGLLLTASASTAATVSVSALEPHGTGLKVRNWLVNDPDYTFSADYRSSVWYQNFTTLQLGENDRNNVLRIAVSQLGYHEGDSAHDFDGMNRNGTGNFMEYGRLLIPHYNNNSYDWCACFVNWCLNQARFDKASSEISCGNWVSELKTMKMWQSSAAFGGTYTPKPADFIFFDWDETGKWPEHIGLVLYTTNTHVYTIEGNTKTDDVGLRSYPLGDKRILGYGTPPYSEGSEPTMDFSYADGMPAGIYVVHDAEATLTDRDGQNPGTKVPLGSTVTFLSETEEKVHVSYKGKSGYLPKSAVCLLTRSFSLTYNANGGKTPPNGLTSHQAVTFSVSLKEPSLSGDRFLGWSTVPYNCKVDYRAGDTISLTHDTVLYAVWEKHSQTLAEQAFAQGHLPEYERPYTIQNGGALLMDGLNGAEAWTDCTDTQLTWEEDSTAGRVSVFSATGEGVAPHATLSYASLCEALKLIPVTGEGAAYAVLRVKDANQSGLSLKLSFNGQTGTASLPLTDGGDWQYLVFDLTANRFAGRLQTLRLDWQSATEAAESRLLLSEIWFAPDEAVRDAILDGKYVYPSQEIKEEETEETESQESEGQTTPAPDEDSTPSESGDESQPLDSSTPPPQDSETGGTSAPPPSDDGCRSSLGSVWGLTALGAAGILAARRKRKQDKNP